MFSRSLSAGFVSRLCAAPFWPNVIQNRFIHPEIRNESVTLYCRGSALIRDLRLDGDRWIARTHPTFIPLQSARGHDLELKCDDGNGFSFVVPPLPLSPALLSAETFAAYTARLPERSEDLLKDAIICHEGNAILDQEVAFADTQSERDRVDLCAYIPGSNALALVEIKLIKDARLQPKNGEIEVISQLNAYSERLFNQGSEILDAYRDVVRLKRRLGLERGLKSVPDNGPQSFLPKPLLVIGGCTDRDIGEIKAGNGRWDALMRELPAVSTSVILCGGPCKLVLGRYGHTLCFD